jgi:hypothetical protein
MVADAERLTDGASHDSSLRLDESGPPLEMVKTGRLPEFVLALPTPGVSILGFCASLMCDD